MSKQKFTKEDLRDKLDGNELDLSLCDLSKVPVREIASLQKATALDLSCNVLTSLPSTFSGLTHLTKLDLSKNSLTELPEDFGRLVNLERLDLYSNKLDSLPISCVHLKKLKWLDLKGNPIQDNLPDVVGNCLSAPECKQCATNMIIYLKRKNAEEERVRQKRLDAEREKKAIEEANAVKEKELRRRQKLQEKQQKREAYAAMERQKKTMAQEAEQKLKDNDSIKDELPVQHKEPQAKGKSWLFLFILLPAGCVLVIALVYCYKNNFSINLNGIWD